MPRFHDKKIVLNSLLASLILAIFLYVSNQENPEELNAAPTSFEDDAGYTQQKLSPDMTGCRFMTRQQRQACETKIYDVHESQLKHFLVHKESKTVLCAPPKSGLVFWTDTMSKISARFKLKQMGLYQIQERKEIFKTYKKIAFVKEPFHRLWSAYNDKFVSPNMFMLQVPKEMPSVLGDGRKADKCVTNTTFLEYVSYIISNDKNNKYQKAEWDGFVHLCRPCELHYDQYVQLEELAENFQTLREILHMSEYSQLTPNSVAKSKWFGTEPDAVLSCMTAEEYEGNKWRVLVNNGLFAESSSLPPRLSNLRIDLNDRNSVIRFNSRLRLGQLSSTLYTSKKEILSKRKQIITKMINTLPQQTRCDLYKVYQADFMMFRYSVRSYDVDVCS